MKQRRGFLIRSFGKGWKWKFPAFLMISLTLALLPSIIWMDKITINTPKFCEEWLKNILSLSAIFIALNYFNYLIGINRSRDKISMLILNFSTVGEGIFMILREDFKKKGEMLNLLISLESLLKKIQNEDEFLYNAEGLSSFSGSATYFEKLKNHINGSTITSSQIDNLYNEFIKIKSYLSNYIYV